jgi:hypothetical protein
MTMEISTARVQLLLDKNDIYEVLTRYCRALDRADFDLMNTVYWPDGIDNHGVFNGNASEFSRFIVDEIQNWFEVTMHGLLNCRIDVEGNFASSETYLFAYHKVREEKASEIFGSKYMDMFDKSGLNPDLHHFYYGGRYLDQFERRDGEWRILKRQCVMDWNDNRPSNEIFTQGMFEVITNPHGERGRGDLVFSNTPQAARESAGKAAAG